MKLIEWNDNLKVGVPEVDADHHQMVDRINGMYRQLRRHESQIYTDDVDPITIVDFMGALYALFSAHFADEESLMLQYGYDHYDQHRADHEKLLDEINSTMYDYQDGVLKDDIKLTGLLANWFSRHFQTHDLRLHSLAGVAAQKATA